MEVNLTNFLTGLCLFIHVESVVVVKCLQVFDNKHLTASIRIRLLKMLYDAVCLVNNIRVVKL